MKNKNYFKQIQLLGRWLTCLTLLMLIGLMNTYASVNYTVTRTAPVVTYTPIAGTSYTWGNGTDKDDNISTATNIGFSFMFDGIARTQFRASTNGFMTFDLTTNTLGNGLGAYGYQNTNFSSASGTKLTIAPMYDDMVVPGVGTLAANMTYLTTGSVGSRILTVQWIGMELFNQAGPDLNFQVKLYEGTNVIEFRYGTMSPSTSTFTYSDGVNSSVGGASVGQLLTQQTANTATFSNTAQDALATVPAATSMITFTPVAGGVSYCTPAFTSYDGTDYIAQVILNTLNNSQAGTAIPCYQNFCPGSGTTTTTLNQSGVYAITVKAGTDANQHFSAYIDFNQNGVFTDANEQIMNDVIIAANASSTSPNFTVPAGATLGTTRLRVVDQYNATPSSCPTSGYGEAEDYCITIAAGSGCTQPTTQATIGAYTNNTNGNSVTVNWTRGNGNNVLVVARLTATTNVDPSSGTSYTANTVFGSGSTTGSGNFAVYNSTGTSVTVTGLTAGSSYTFTCYEYATTGICYKTPGSSSAVTIANPPPANDAAASAINIVSLPYTSAVISNAAATDDYVTSSCDGPYKNVWWTVTGICGTMTAITCTGGTNFDDEISIFTGTPGSFTEVICNDDNGAGCTSNYAGVSWTATSGTVYYISVGSYYSAGVTGNLQLNVTATPFTSSVAPTGATGNTTICNGGNTLLTVSGGTKGTGATTQWFTGSCGGTSAGATDAITVSPTTTTTYYVRYSGTCNTTTCGTASVTVNPRPTASVSGSTTICNGQSSSISITVTGPGTKSGTLSPGAIPFSGSTSPISVSVSPSSNTTYSVASLADANCTSISGDLTGSRTVNVNTRPTASVSGSSTICNGGSSSISISVTGSGTISGTLSPGAIPFSGTAPTISVNVSPSSNTSYTVAGLADANCTSIAGDLTGSRTVNVNARPTASVSGSSTICNGGSSSISISVTGSGTISGTLSPGAIPFSGTAPTISVNVSPSSNTSYTVAGLADANCTSIAGDLTGSRTVNVNARPTASVSGSSAICDGGSSSISISVTGSGTISGTLSPGAIPFSGTAPTISVSVSPLSNTSYSVATLSDANCSAIAGDLTGSHTVNINSRPTASVSGSSTICDGGSSSISVSVTGSGTISGTLSPGAVPFSGTAPTISVSVSPSSNTTYSVATLADANCSSTAGDLTGSHTVNVDSRPTASVSGSTTICDGGSSSISISVTGSGTISGTLSPGAIPFSGTAPTISVNVSPSSNTSYTVAGLADANCTSIAGDLTGSRTVNVNARPTASVSGSSTICNGGSSSISISVTGSGTISGTLSPGAIPFSGTAPTISVSVSPLSNTSYSVATLSDANCSAIAGDLTGSHTVNINSRPTASVSGSSTICDGGSSSISISVTGSGTISGTLSPGAVPFSGIAPTISVSVSPSSNTTYSVATLADANCSSTAGDLTGSHTVNVDSRPTASVSGSTTICDGGSSSISISVTGSGTISGTLSPGAIPFSGTAPTISVSVSPSSNTSYSVATLADANCSSIAGDLTGTSTVNVTAAPTAAIALAGSADKCLGQSATVSLTFTGTGPWNYTIMGSGGPYTGSTSSNPANINVTPTATGTQTYTVTSTGNATCPTGGTTSGSATVYVSTIPPPSSGPVPAGAAEACVSSVILITSNVISGQNIIYSWNTGSNSSTVLFSTNIGGPFTAGPFQTTTNQVYAQFGALGGGQSGYQVCLQGVNGCGSSINKCLWLRGVVSGPGAITPANGVVACENTTQLYSCGIASGATVYNWTLNGSAAAVTPNSGNNPTNVSVAFPSGFTTGQLCVTAALSCGGSSTSAPRCVTINKNPANPNVPSGAAAVCPGATGVSYSIPVVPGASGYNWTVPANATIATGANSSAITVNFPASYSGSSSVCVTTTSACGASAVKCKTISSGIPNQPAGITGPLANICGSTVQYSVVSPPGGLTYTWTNPAGTTISGSATGSTILLNVSSSFTSGVLTVAANSALCAPATSAVRTSSTVWGRPNNPGTITQYPPGPFCSGAGLTFSVVNPVVGPVPNYTWTSSNGAITSSQGPNNIDVTWGASAPGTIAVKASNTCGLSAGTSSQVFTPAGCREEGMSTSSSSFSVYPNPAYDKVTVNIDVKEQAQFNVKFLDMSGRVIFSEDHEAAAGINAYELDLKLLAKGIYSLEVRSSQESWKEKVVVQ